MSKRAKILVSALVVVLLLTAGATVTVMAQEEKPTPPPVRGVLIARVAQILGIPQKDLVNAFRQAQQEIRQETFARALDKAVEQGRLTEEEATKIKEWWQQKPETLDGLFQRLWHAIKEWRWARMTNAQAS